MLQYVIVPVTQDSKSFGNQYGFSRCVALGGRVLTAIDFNDEALFEANEIENKALKSDLPAKLKKR